MGSKYELLNNLTVMIQNSARALIAGREIEWCNYMVEMVRTVENVRTILKEEDEEKKLSEAKDNEICDSGE